MRKIFKIILLFVSIIVAVESSSSEECSSDTIDAGVDYIHVIQSHASSTNATNYPNNVDQCWVIKAEMGGKVKLYFQSFELQPKVNGICKDWLKVYDGNEIDSSNLKGEYCGNTLNNTNIKSSGKYMTLVLKTDSTITDKGFTIHMYSVEANWYYHGDGFRALTGSIHAVIIVIIVILVVAAVVAVVGIVIALLHEKRMKKKKAQQNSNAANSNSYPVVSVDPLPPKAF